MKLASINNGTRDGQLAVVSHNLSQAHIANHIAPTLQSVLDDWHFFAPQLAQLSEELNSGQTRYAFTFDTRQCLAPLPRAFSANRKSNKDVSIFKNELLPSEHFLSATDSICYPSSAQGIYSDLQLLLISAELSSQTFKQHKTMTDCIRLFGLGAIHHLVFDQAHTNVLPVLNLTQAAVFVTPDELYHEHGLSSHESNTDTQHVIKKDPMQSENVELLTLPTYQQLMQHLEAYTQIKKIQNGSIFCMSLEEPTSERKNKLLVPGERVYANLFMKHLAEQISIFGAIDQGIQTISSLNLS